MRDYFNENALFGEEDFTERSESYDRQSSYHDSWEYERERERDRREKEHESGKDDDEEQAKEPFEKVRIRVDYPRLTDRESTLTLERWIPWEQVYGGKEGEEPEAPAGEENPE